MAVDGVAPRAKMNQQRGRRFRSAKEAELLEKRAEAKGEKLPSEARFDSNCITPGTVFMARLHEQLKYFVASKISTDQRWKGVKVILSGHETPGEGEHKIMEYIRWMKTQPGYDPNTRHCLYGLDADLMMLGLCTHEPHFSLLREEVKFGKQSKRTSVPEETRFYLLHLSLMREYLGLEFQALKDKLKFPFDVESIIDDWVLMGFLVGNDFIPHLPDVHIASGALPMLYNAYIDVLPSLDGYINENGFLNLGRFQKFMEKLAAFDLNQFKESYADMKYFESKTNRKMGTKVDDVQEDASSGSKTGISELDALIKATNEMVLEKFFDDEDGETGTVDEEEDDVDVFASRVYDDDSDSEVSDTFRWEFHQHKKDYYRNKLEYGKVTEQVLRDQAEGYVRAIQWNLHYYYHGVASWSWYYPHHYAPYVSDICNFKDLTLEFKLGEPFKPFEQLLAVLPSASKSLLPAPYRDLMTQEISPILEYYPPDFQTDLNGKKQDWEAVVLIPFIDEQRLLSAMTPCLEKLSDAEKDRNKFGPMLEYTFSDSDLGEYVAPEYFATIKHNRAQLREILREDLHLDRKEIAFGLPPGVRLDVYFPGFPTFKHLPFSGELRKAKVQVFDQASRGDNMILTLLNTKEVSSLTLQDAADKFLGKDVYCGWPHLSEGKVVGVADGSKRYNLLTSGKVAVESLSNNLAAQCESTKKAVASEYMRRLGVNIGDVHLILYVNHVSGRKYVFGQAGKITLEKMYSEIQDPYAIQTVVKDIAVHDSSFVQYKTLEQVFPQGSKCFLLAPPVYGSMGEVLEVKKQPEGRLFLKIVTNGEPDVDYVRHNQYAMKPQYMTGGKAAQHIGISSHILSRITGTVFLVVGNKQADNPSKINIGLNLKFNKKNEEVPGFTRKENNMWLYSRKSVELLKEYVEKFPEVFEHISRQTSDDVYDDKDIFRGDNCSDKVAELSKWLKEVPSANVERQSCGAEILDEEVVAQLQDVVELFVQSPPESKRLKLQVKPHVVYKCELRVGNMAPDPSTTYQLFDRVVNVRDDTTVPLGLKGTIIGIRHSENAADTMFDVLFDQEFPSAMSLAGSKKCAYRVSRTALINVSHGYRQKLVDESYRSVKAHPQRNSAFAKWTGKENAGKSPAANFKSAHTSKVSASEQSPGRRHAESANKPPAGNKPNNFKFPAPPNVQILSKESSTTSDASRTQLWNQLQMVSGKGANQFPHPTPPPPTALPKPNENMTNVMETKTNVLKLMLGVNSATAVKDDDMANMVTSAPKEQVLAGQVTTKQQCEITPYAKDVCGFLLQFFQRKGVGVPTYSVATMGANEVAQLKLPDGTIIRGKPAPTKQTAAENAAMEALHLLKVCRVCDGSENTPQQHAPVPAKPQFQLSGQPQQFFEQFRQGQFPPPPRPAAPSGNPGWIESGHRPTLVRASFPQGPPPFPQAVLYPPNYQQHAQPLGKQQFVQLSQPQYFYQQCSPQRKPHQREQQPSNHNQRQRDFDGSNNRVSKQPSQRQSHQDQKKDSNSFVPLQAMKKQRNSRKSGLSQNNERHESKGTAQSSTTLKEGKLLSDKSAEAVPSGSSHSFSEKKKRDTENNHKSLKESTNNDQPSSRSVSKMKKSRLAINFQPS